MRKALSTLLLLATPAFAFSACNSPQAGVPSVGSGMTSNHVTSANGHKHRHDFSAADLHAGGATFPAFAYNGGNQPVGVAENNNVPSPQQPPATNSLFDLAPTNGTIYYCLTGSGFGRGAFVANNSTANVACQPLGASPSGFGARQDPLDFVGSDVMMKSSEYTTYNTSRGLGSSLNPNFGEPFVIPVIGGPIVIGYRQKDFKANVGTTTVQLSTWTMCAIANGIVSDWNDPAITADNGGKSITGGASKTITFYFRSDSSGTSFLFTTHLAAVCKSSGWKAPYNAAPYESNGHSAAWAYGANSNWPGPGCTAQGCPGPANANFIGQSGNPGVLAAIQGTPFGTGYVEGAWAKAASPVVAQAALQSGRDSHGNAVFINPLTNHAAVVNALNAVGANFISYGMGSDNVALGSTRPECQLYINPTHFTLAPTGTYPVMGVSYLLFYGANNAHYTDLKALIGYLVTTPAAQAMNADEYVPLSGSVRVAVKNALNGTGAKYQAHGACIKS